MYIFYVYAYRKIVDEDSAEESTRCTGRENNVTEDSERELGSAEEDREGNENEINKRAKERKHAPAGDRVHRRIRSRDKLIRRTNGT